MSQDDAADIERQALARFADLLQLPAAERARAVAAIDAPLREKVQALMREDQGTEVFESSELATPHVPIPETVGPYRVCELIGQGGMGSVYRGERTDGTFERAVAIKFLDVGRFSPERMTRFERERRISAQLDHPNIVKLLDGGEVQGVPYLIMDLVQGRSLREFFCDRPGYDQRQSLEIFVQVCRGVAFAHDNLVLHRDLKPENVLVDSQLQPKLLDFGIARFEAEPEHYTQPGRMPMTPVFTSPECLIGAPATVRSEVYALGVMLYEMLHGELPYQLGEQTLLEFHQAVTQSARVDAATGHTDLDVILTTAMHVDPERRYASAHALADDLERYLQGRAISARRDETSYVIGRFIRRNKALVSLATIAALSLVGGLAATGIALVEAEQQRSLANAEARTARQAVTFLAETLTGANPHSGLDQIATIAEALDRADTELTLRFSDDPETQAYLTSRLAAIYSGRGEINKAWDYVQRAQNIQARLTPEAQRFRYDNYRSWGDVAVSAGRFDEAIAFLDEALQELKAQPDRERQFHDLMEVRALKCLAQAQRGEVERGAACAQQLISDFDGHADAQALASAHNTLAMLAFNQGDLVQAEIHLNAAIATMATMGLSDTPNALQLRMNQASLVSRNGRWSEAEALFLDTIAAMESAMGDSHRWVLRGVANLGAQYQHAGSADTAIELMRPYVERIETAYPDADTDAAHLRAKYGDALCRVGETEAGLSMLRRARDAYRALLKTDDWRSAEVARALTACEQQQ